MTPQSSIVTFRAFSDGDATALQVLFDRCSEFFELTEGAAAGPDSAANELLLRAPGKPPDDTFCFGVHRGDRLAGFVHLTRDYPKSNEWWLGLMLLDPDERRRGLGREIHDALLRWVVLHGAQVLWLGVLQQNATAERFWRRQGYVERERQKYVSASGLKSTIILMSLPLAPRP